MGKRRNGREEMRRMRGERRDMGERRKEWIKERWGKGKEGWVRKCV